MIFAFIQLLSGLCFAQEPTTTTPENENLGDMGTPVDDPFNPLPPAVEEEDTNASQEGTDRIYIEDGSVIEGRIIGYHEKKLILLTSALCVPLDISLCNSLNFFSFSLMPLIILVIVSVAIM